jgi:dihydroorotase
MSLLIKNGTIVHMEETADIWIENKRIIEIATHINKTADKEIDARGLHVFLGFADLHCHLREPGFTQKEDISSGSRSAAAGGFTQVCCMPNTNPPIDNQQLVRFIKNHEAYVKVYPVACITEGQKGEEPTSFSVLIRSGAAAFSDDGLPVKDAAVMKKAMMLAKPIGALLMLHEEDLELRGDGAANEGKNAIIANIKGIPASSEEVMVARDIILAEETGCPVHFCHISTKGSVRMIRDAKKRGVRITCETAPHYFSLDDSAILSLDTNTKVNPPLRSAEDVRAILEGIANGTLDVIATDHAPHTREDKSGGYGRAAFGLIGFETAFSLGYMHLVESGLITLRRLEELMSINPRKILGSGGSLKEGEIADITICDLNKKYLYKKESVVSRSKNSPFLGLELKGEVEYTIVDGGLRYDRQADR